VYRGQKKKNECLITGLYMFKRDKKGGQTTCTAVIRQRGREGSSILNQAGQHQLRKRRPVFDLIANKSAKKKKKGGKHFWWPNSEKEGGGGLKYSRTLKEKKPEKPRIVSGGKRGGG